MVRAFSSCSSGSRRVEPGISISSLDRRPGLSSLQIGLGEGGVRHAAGRALGIGGELREVGHLVDAAKAARIEDFGFLSPK
jgi:hypothetical protein